MKVDISDMIIVWNPVYRHWYYVGGLMGASVRNLVDRPYCTLSPKNFFSNRKLMR